MSRATPKPISYIMARWVHASTCPPSQASAYSAAARGKFCGAPWPVSYMWASCVQLRERSWRQAHSQSLTLVQAVTTTAGVASMAAEGGRVTEVEQPATNT